MLELFSNMKEPQIEKLTIKKILNSENKSYLSTYDYNKYRDRYWICDVLNTLKYDEFQLFIKNSLKEIEKYLINKFNLISITVIAKIFKESQSISSFIGRTHFWMRSEYGFIKRMHPEEDIKSEEHDQSETINKLNIELNSLQKRLKPIKEEKQTCFITRKSWRNYMIKGL